MPDQRRARTARQPQTDTPHTWTAERIRALGATTDVVTAGQILGISRNSAYALAQRGEFPLPVIKAGTRYRVPVAAILAALAADPPTGSPSPARPR